MNNILDRLEEEKQMRLKGGLYHYTQVKFAYNSNRIEGSKLTEEETRYIYETFTISTGDKKTAKVDDIVETINHFGCFNYLLEIAEKPLSEEIIKNFHKILKTGTSDSLKNWFKVGDYKKMENIVGDMETSPVKEVRGKMKNLLNDYLKEKADINKIVEFHYNFEKIHPFQDGNGRVGRLIMFKECLKNNIPPFIIEDNIKQFYYLGLKEYPKSKTRLVETCLYSQEVYKDILNYFKIKYNGKTARGNKNKKSKKDELLENIKTQPARKDDIKHLKYHTATFELGELLENITKVTELEKINSKISKLTYKNKNDFDMYVLQRKNILNVEIWHFNYDFNKKQALQFLKKWDESRGSNRNRQKKSYKT
jgi:Fic family protein